MTSIRNPINNEPNAYGRAVGAPLNFAGEYIRRGGLLGYVIPIYGDKFSENVDGTVRFFKRGGLMGALIPAYGSRFEQSVDKGLVKPIKWLNEGGLLGHL